MHECGEGLITSGSGGIEESRVAYPWGRKARVPLPRGSSGMFECIIIFDEVLKRCLCFMRHSVSVFSCVCLYMSASTGLCYVCVYSHTYGGDFLFFKDRYEYAYSSLYNGIFLSLFQYAFPFKNFTQQESAD